MRKRRGTDAEISTERHKTGLLAAAGAVILGVVALGAAVSGGTWLSGDPGSLRHAATPVEGPADASEAAAKTAAVGDAADQVQKARSENLSPDERIARATAHVPVRRADSEVSEALADAVRAKTQDMRESIADTAFTAAIPSSTAYAPAAVEMAETAAHISALQAIRSVDRSDEAAPAETEQESAAPEEQPVAAAVPTGSLVPATVTRAVNLRAGPDNHATVLTTVPAAAAVQASTDCPVWCEVVYDGRRGYVYKAFIRREANAAGDAAASADAETTASIQPKNENRAGLTRRAAERMQQTR